MLPEPARNDALPAMPKDGSLGAAVTAAMEAVEDHFPPLAGQLPKDYERFEDNVPEEMMRTFDSEALRTASGDVFSRIYEYFLAEFSRQGAHDNGEFFTPPSIVQTIVNVIEPDHGVILDPASLVDSTGFTRIKGLRDAVEAVHNSDGATLTAGSTAALRSPATFRPRPSIVSEPGLRIVRIQEEQLERRRTGTDAGVRA